MHRHFFVLSWYLLYRYIVLSNWLALQLIDVIVWPLQALIYLPLVLTVGCNSCIYIVARIANPR